MPNINSLLDDHVVLKYECLDRIFLNGYVAKLQQPDQLSWFLCQQRGEAIPRYQVLGVKDGKTLAYIDSGIEAAPRTWLILRLPAHCGTPIPPWVVAVLLNTHLPDLGQNQ